MRNFGYDADVIACASAKVSHNQYTITASQSTVDICGESFKLRPGQRLVRLDKINGDDDSRFTIADFSSIKWE